MQILEERRELNTPGGQRIVSILLGALLGSSLGVLKAGADLPTWTIVGVPAIVAIAAGHPSRLRPIRPRPTDVPTTEAAPA